MVIVVDAEDRENEGDFVCAAEKATPEVVNFMLRHGRGQVCMPILPEVARRLELPPMVQANSTPLGTAFTVPVDHRTARTGITAGERADTIAAIMDPASTPADFVRPGHLFPLLAKEGGVLRRARVHEVAERLVVMPHSSLLPDLFGQVRLVWQSGTVALGGAVLDAMAGGVPVVAVASDAARQLVVDGETGWIAPPLPESDFPRRAFKILEDESQAARMAAAGAARAAACFPAAASVAAHVALPERPAG